MKQKFFITFNSGATMPRLTLNRPAVKPNEVCAEFAVEVPDILFRRPSIYAEIKIPEPDTPAVLTTQLVGDVVDAVRKATGLEVNMQLIEHEVETDESS